VQLLKALPLLLPLLASDVAAVAAASSSSSLSSMSFFAAGATSVGVMTLAAGVALSAALAIVISQKTYQERLATWMAVEGDEVEVHVTVSA
jgi:hypothetical protein